MIEIYELRDIVNECCTCGGEGPGPDACPACMVWHYAVTLPEMARGHRHEFDAVCNIAAFLHWATRR